jgi:hypothetical protein
MFRVFTAMVATLALWTSLSVIGSQPAQAQVGPALTDQTLNTMLTDMGYAPSALSKGYLISLKQDTWTVYVQLVLSPDTTKLGFNSNLGAVPNANAVTAAQWMGLIAANADIDPDFFYFDKPKQKLYLHRVLDNRGITPAFLRTQIDLFVGHLKSTKDLWSFTT